MPYITPSSTPSTTVRRCLFIPDHPLWLAAVSGALTELTKAYNWEDLDGITPAEAVEAAQVMIDIYYSGECDNMIGELVAFALEGNLPDDFLLMDGSQYYIADYATLASLIPTQWLDVPNGTFVLPSMQKRTLVGMSEETDFHVGDDGGAQTVTLTTANLPAHTHPPLSPTTAYLGSVASGGGGNVVAGTTFQLASTTGSTGSGTAHNNMMPYIAIKWGIRWR